MLGGIIPEHVQMHRAVFFVRNIALCKKEGINQSMALFTFCANKSLEFPGKSGFCCLMRPIERPDGSGEWEKLARRGSVVCRRIVVGPL